MVKVLVATTEAQGDRGDDYAWAVDGELVYVPFDQCDCPGCGCSRGFAGMASARASTTCLVVDRPDLEPMDLFHLLSDSLERQGWVGDMRTDEDDDGLRLVFQRLLAAGAHFPAGSILERDGQILRRRAQAEPLHVPADAAEDRDR